MFTIITFLLACLGILLSTASLINSNRLRAQFSRNRLKKDILEVKDDVLHLVRNLEREWEDTYDKLRKIMGRYDRAKRSQQSPADDNGMIENASPEAIKMAIIRRARAEGKY